MRRRPAPSRSPGVTSWACSTSARRSSCWSPTPTSRPPRGLPPATSSAWARRCSGLLRCRRDVEAPFPLPRRASKGGGERLEEALARPFLGAEAGEVVGVDLAVDEADAAAGQVLHEND